MGTQRKPDCNALGGRLAFSLDEAGALLGAGPASMDRWAKSGAVVTFKIGGRRFVARAVLESLCRGERPAVPDPPTAA